MVVYLIFFTKQSKKCYKQSKEISIPQRLKILRQISRTMAFVHGSGIVHRDIKSFNILLDDNLDVKICDFGLAKFNVNFF
jgi:serine/threonine-protein kinase